MTTQTKRKRHAHRKWAVQKLGPFGYLRDKDGCDDTWTIYDAADGLDIASIPFWDCDPVWTERSEATARLFAASPELLLALEELVTGWPNAEADLYHEAVERASAVIARAIGRD